MDPKTDGLREVFQGGGEAPGPSKEPGPPISPESIWRGVRGELSPEALGPIVDRMAWDEDLATEWRLAMALVEGDAQSSTLDPGVPPKARSGLWGAWGSKALGVLCALGLLGVVVWQLPGPGEPTPRVLRNGGGDVTLESLLVDGAPLPRGEFVLRWRPGPMGSTYDLFVTDASLGVLEIKRGLPRALHQVNEGAFSGLPVGAEILWRVECVSPEGVRRASETFVQTLGGP